MHKSALILAVAAIVLTACASGPAVSPAPGSPGPGITAGPTAPPSPSPTPSPSPIGNANVAVVRIEQTGGMLPPWETLRWYPTVVLYGDGRLIMEGPQIEIFPGPALPNLVVTRLSQAGVDQVLAWAVEAGLDGPDRQLGPQILDAGATVFTIVSADGTHRTSITDPSATDAQIGAARQFQNILQSPRTWLADQIAGDDTPYAFDRLRLISFPSDEQNLPDPGMANTVDWPLDTALSTLGTSWGEPPEYRCALVEGEDLTTLRPMLEQANELTLWRSDDVTYQLYLRPLLPDEEACPGF